MSECCTIAGIECVMGLNKQKCPHHRRHDDKPYRCGECGKEKECSDTFCAWAGPTPRPSLAAPQEKQVGFLGFDREAETAPPSPQAAISDELAAAMLGNRPAPLSAIATTGEKK